MEYSIVFSVITPSHYTVSCDLKTQESRRYNEGRVYILLLSVLLCFMIGWVVEAVRSMPRQPPVFTSSPIHPHQINNTL